jgi:hypothetical protein
MLQIKGITLQPLQTGLSIDQYMTLYILADFCPVTEFGCKGCGDQRERLRMTDQVPGARQDQCVNGDLLERDLESCEGDRGEPKAG